MPRDVAMVCRLAVGIGCIAVALDCGIVSTICALIVSAIALQVLNLFDN